MAAAVVHSHTHTLSSSLLSSIWIGSDGAGLPEFAHRLILTRMAPPTRDIPVPRLELHHNGQGASPPSVPLPSSPVPLNQRKLSVYFRSTANPVHGLALSPHSRAFTTVCLEKITSRGEPTIIQRFRHLVKFHVTSRNPPEQIHPVRAQVTCSPSAPLSHAR